MSLPAHVVDTLSDLLNQVHDVFKEDCICTLIMRCPGKPDTELVMGNDDPEEVINVIRRRVEEEVK